MTGPLNSRADATSILTGGVYNASAPSPSNGQTCALQVDASGNLLVNAIVGGSSVISVVPGLPTTAATTLTNGNTSSSGWTSIVAGSGTKTIRLWRVIVSANAATNIEFGDGSTAFLGPYYLQAGGSIVLDISGEPWYVTAAGSALEINSSNAVAITYSTWTTES